MTLADSDAPEDLRTIREAIAAVCAAFPDRYWREKDEADEYPTEFVDTLTEGGWLSVMIPEEYGGGGLGVREAAVILEEINRSGGSATACHAQMYTMGALLRHGSEQQKRRYLPDIAAGELRLQSFAVTEADAGSDTSRIRTSARREGDHYVINGTKTYISRVEQTDLIMLLCRTSPAGDKRTDGLSILLVDRREAGPGLTVSPIRTMVSHHTYELSFDDVRVPAENLIGEEGKGFTYILSGMNAERVLVAAESVGDARYFTERAIAYASEREVFGRPIGANQGIQFPIAKAYMLAESAALVCAEAARLFDAGSRDGAAANMAKYLASEAAWEAACACMSTFGGNGLAVEYGIERKFRAARLPLVAPVSNNLVLSYVAQHVLGLPRSY